VVVCNSCNRFCNVHSFEAGGSTHAVLPPLTATARLKLQGPAKPSTAEPIPIPLPLNTDTAAAKPRTLNHQPYTALKLDSLDGSAFLVAPVGCCGTVQVWRCHSPSLRCHSYEIKCYSSVCSGNDRSNSRTDNGKRWAYVRRGLNSQDG